MIDFLTASAIQKRPAPRRSGTVARFGLGLLVALWLGAASTATAQEEALRKNSPFLPPGYNDPEPEVVQPVIATGGAVAREIEFRGVFELGGEFRFSLFNKSQQKGYWLKRNATEDGLTVRDFDREAMALTVQYNGRTERLNLITSSDSPVPVAVSTTAPQRPNISGPSVQPTVQSGSSNTERRRVIPRRRVILPKN